jgi:hypothetical protein
MEGVGEVDQSEPPIAEKAQIEPARSGPLGVLFSAGKKR